MKTFEIDFCSIHRVLTEPEFFLQIFLSTLCFFPSYDKLPGKKKEKVFYLFWGMAFALMFVYQNFHVHLMNFSWRLVYADINPE